MEEEGSIIHLQDHPEAEFQPFPGQLFWLEEEAHTSTAHPADHYAGVILIFGII